MSEQTRIRAEEAAELVASAYERGEPRLDAAAETQLDVWRSTLPAPSQETPASRLCGH